jgi:hypothetical protein
MFGIEKDLFGQLLYLKEAYSLAGIKAEFEAEGSSFNDVARLRRLTERAGVGLFLKIGGVEAVRDIKDSLELGVDGLVAPMVESRFGLKKFMEAYRSVYGEHRVKLAINIETKGAVDDLEGILDLAEGFVDGVTLGRTDLSASYLDPAVTPDCEFIAGLANRVGARVRARGLDFTLGGSVSAASLEAFRAEPAIVESVQRIETRKVILPRDVMLAKAGALDEALRLEELCILSKKELGDAMLAADLERLEKLRSRAARPIGALA